MQVANSIQARKVIRAFFESNDIVPSSTWSEASRAINPNNMLNLSWCVGFMENPTDIQQKAQAAMLAAGFTNRVKVTANLYLRLQAPRP